jgi:hypothetical protein
VTEWGCHVKPQILHYESRGNDPQRRFPWVRFVLGCPALSVALFLAQEILYIAGIPPPPFDMPALTALMIIATAAAAGGAIAGLGLMFSRGASLFLRLFGAVAVLADMALELFLYDWMTGGKVRIMLGI